MRAYIYMKQWSLKKQSTAFLEALSRAIAMLVQQVIKICTGRPTARQIVFIDISNTYSKTACAGLSIQRL